MVAWLMLAAGEHRQHGGNEGYDDHPERSYGWDSTVPHCDEPKKGDIIVLWDTVTLLGVSVIEHIVPGTLRKPRRSCPYCEMASIKPRAKKRPRYHCRGCKQTFEEPKSRLETVRTFRTEHSEAWVNLEGRLDGRTLRGLCVKPKSIQSIRELRWEAFLGSLSAPDARGVRNIIGAATGAIGANAAGASSKAIPGGHRTKNGPVRVRVGQRAFRLALLKQFGSVCAFTGEQPEAVLDAAHLYSYASVGQHHEHGGLLIRKDLHRLFDLGLIAVDPQTNAIDVHASISKFGEYKKLHATSIAVPMEKAATRWLKEHWAQHRGGASEQT